MREWLASIQVKLEEAIASLVMLNNWKRKSGWREPTNNQQG